MLVEMSLSTGYPISWFYQNWTVGDFEYLIAKRMDDPSETIKENIRCGLIRHSVLSTIPTKTKFDLADLIPTFKPRPPALTGKDAEKIMLGFAAGKDHIAVKRKKKRKIN